MKRLASLLLLVLTACTSGQGPALRPAPAGARPGGVLRVGITQPGSVDPGNDYEPAGDLVIRTMCDPLIAADPATGELRPALAQSWVVTDRGQRLVIRLRKEARFSDGSTVTADDVLRSWSRIASTDYASSVASLLAPVDGYPEVHGDKPTDSDQKRRQLSGLSALDQRSLQITLDRPLGDFVRLLTSPVVTPVPRERAGQPAFAARPVCSGPYALDAPVTRKSTVIGLHRVTDRRALDTSLTGGGRGYADRIEFHVFRDAGSAAAAARRGQVDLAAASPADRAGVRSGPAGLVDLIGLPTGTSPLFDQPDARRALALALDREALARQVFPGTRTAATGFLPPTDLPVFTPNACSGLPLHGDPSRARALLHGADLRTTRVPLYVNDDGRNVALARAVAAQWRSVLGLTAVVTPMPFAAFLSAGSSPKGFDGPFRFSWATPYADPDGFLNALFSSDRIGRDNLARFDDATFDRILQRQARQATDAADRTLAYRQAEQRLCEQLPMIPVTFSLSRWLISPRWATASRYLDATTGQPLLRELYLSARRP